MLDEIDLIWGGVDWRAEGGIFGSRDGWVRDFFTFVDEYEGV